MTCNKTKCTESGWECCRSCQKGVECAERCDNSLDGDRCRNRDQEMEQLQLLLSRASTRELKLILTFARALLGKEVKEIQT